MIPATHGHLPAAGSGCIVGFAMGQPPRVRRRSGAWRKRAVAAVTLALLAPGVFAAVASAQEYCVGGCIWGVNCPTQPHPEPGHVELPLCEDPVGGGEPVRQETAPIPAIVTEERGEATGASAATLSAKIDPQGYGIQSIIWQYSSEVDIFGGEVSLPSDHSEVSGGSEIEGSASGPVENSVSLSSLQPGTSYSFRVVVESRDGAIAYGQIESFRTPAVSEPSSTTTTSTSTIAAGASSDGIEESPAPAGQTPARGEPLASPAPQTTTTIATASAPPVRPADYAVKPSAPNPPTRAQTLARALKACPVKPTSRRTKCLRKAEKRYSPSRKR
jgi:hypothetical protein